MVLCVFIRCLCATVRTNLLFDFYSFNDTQTMNQFTGFTLDNYRNVFEDTRLLTIVLNTFLLAFLSALIATIIGTFGAMGIYYTKRRKTGTRCLALITFYSFHQMLLLSQFLNFLHGSRVYQFRFYKCIIVAYCL